MAVIESNKEVVKLGAIYLVKLEAIGDLGVYDLQVSYNHEPSVDEIDKVSQSWISELENQEEVQKNIFNTTLMSELNNYTLEVVKDCVLYIRNNPLVAETDFKLWFTTESHPQSIFNIDNLLLYLYQATGTVNFDGLKDYVVNHKFVGVDI